MLDSTVGLDAYTRDDPLTRQILAHYEANLHRLVDLAGAGDANVLFVTPAASLKDCRPFKSEHRSDLAPERQRAWDTLMEQAQADRARGDWSQAAANYQAAARIDDRHAETQYRLGQALFALNRSHAAREAFLRAIDEDVCPLRALSTIPRIVRRLARQRNVPLADFAAALDAESQRQFGHRVPGQEFF